VTVYAATYYYYHEYFIHGFILCQPYGDGCNGLR